MVLSLIVVLAALMALMGLLWLVSVRLSNGAVADVGWGSGFIVAALLHMLLGGSGTLTAWIMTAMVTLWGGRLSWHIWRDRVSGGKAEDARYRDFRTKWGKSANLNLLGFFQLQAPLISIVSLPVALVAHDPAGGFGGVQAAGLLLWTVAFAGETIADGQLRKFKSDVSNHRKVCQAGLWRYSRHPNYFFEWLLWVGLALMASDASPAWPAYLSPLVMLWLLVKVTGIPLAEAQSLKNRGDAFREYQRTTSPFIPWFRKEKQIA